MSIVARAPGKLVILGEYAVLTGAPALVLAVDRACEAEIRQTDGEINTLEVCAPELVRTSFRRGMDSGEDLIDIVCATGSADELAWSGRVDSSAFFDGTAKLGIGSSAAALTCWAAAWAAFTGNTPIRKDSASLEALISQHRRFQGGVGSGLDIAASLFGGVISYTLQSGAPPMVSSVGLPNSVGFTTVFTGRSASTRNFVAAFSQWRASVPSEAEQLLCSMEQVAIEGCAAAGEHDADSFLRALAKYGEYLGVLGESTGAEIVTSEHRDIAGCAGKFGVVYKVSGAGGGDMGMAFSPDPEALLAFRKAIARSYRVIDFGLDSSGLCVEEHM